MKKLGLVLSILVLFAASSLAVAQKQSKIGFVDFQKILDESMEGKKAQAILKKEFGTVEEQLKKKKGELMELKDQIDKQEAVLNKPTLDEKKALLRVKWEALMRQQMEFQEKITKRRLDLIKPIIMEIAQIAEVVGKEREYTIIFKRSTKGEQDTVMELLLADSTIIYASPDTDLTPEVLKRYNARHPQ